MGERIEELEREAERKMIERLKDLEKELMQMIQATDISEIIRKEKEKYKPLNNWRKANPEKPKNLYEAVIQRETYKTACIKVFGEY